MNQNYIFGLFILLLLSSCEITKSNKSGSNYKSLNPELLLNLSNEELFTVVTFQIEDNLGSIREITDSLRLMWTVHELQSHSYDSKPRAILDSLEAEFENNSNLLLSQEQFRIVLNIQIDSTSIIKDSTFVFISEANDTTYASVTASEMTQIYYLNKISSFEQDTIIVNNFNLRNDYQSQSFNRFKRGVQVANLVWLPDSTFSPSKPFFRLETNTVVFGTFEFADRSTTYNLLQQDFLKKYRLHLEDIF
jgi:hypothetical protein